MQSHHTYISQCVQHQSELTDFWDAFLERNFLSLLASEKEYMDADGPGLPMPILFPTDTIDKDKDFRFLVGASDWMDQPICELAIEQGIDIIVLQHEVGQRDAVTEVLLTSKNLGAHLYSASEVYTTFTHRGHYAKIWFPMDDGIVVGDEEGKAVRIRATNDILRDAFLNFKSFRPIPRLPQCKNDKTVARRFDVEIFHPLAAGLRFMKTLVSKETSETLARIFHTTPAGAEQIAGVVQQADTEGDMHAALKHLLENLNALPAPPEVHFMEKVEPPQLNEKWRCDGRLELNRATHLTARLLSKVYHAGCAFPTWVYSYWKRLEDELMPKCITFFAHDSSSRDGGRNLAKCLSYLRMPAVFGDKTLYEGKHMTFYESRFGPEWESWHERFYTKHNRLAPPVCIYAPTFVQVAGPADPDLVVHVLCAPQLAFDSEDRSHVHALRGNVPAARAECTKIFQLVFAAARHLGMQVVVLSVPSAYMCREWPGGRDAFARDVWMPALRLPDDLVCLLMNAKDVPAIWEPYSQQVPGARDPGPFPENLLKIVDATGVPLRHTLFVDNLHPLALPGNGHQCTPDGIIGSRTAITLLCWPGTNLFLRGGDNVIGLNV